MNKTTKEKDNKDELSQEDIINGIKTVEPQTKPHPALETAEGKNNGAKPAAYKDQVINRP